MRTSNLPPIAAQRVPSLVDSHVAAFHLRALLAQGFTTVRDMGGATARDREAVAEWLIPGPRLLVGGKVLCQSGGHRE